MVVAEDSFGIQMRRAVPEDVEELRALYRRSSLSNEGDRANLLAHPDALEWSSSPVDEDRTIVAVAIEHEHRVVGFATTFEASGFVELEDLFVDPRYMRRGIGRRLVGEVLAGAREHGFGRIEVTANHHALAFYETVGFVIDGETETRFGTAPRMHLSV